MGPGWAHYLGPVSFSLQGGCVNKGQESRVRPRVRQVRHGSQAHTGWAGSRLILVPALQDRALQSEQPRAGQASLSGLSGSCNLLYPIT